MRVTHKSHIRTDQISTSFIITFQISSFFVFFFLFYTHVIHSHELLGFGGCRTGDVDSEKNVHSLFRMIDIRKERKLTDILCVHLCSSPQQKKQTRKKNLISLSYLLNFLSFFLFFFLHALQTNTML